MRWLDWVVVVVYLIWIVTSGLRASRRTNEVDGYFRANRSLPWWAVGLSVMATQLSAITLVGTTGQGYADGMKFVQFYFGLPIAMVILSMTRRAVLLPREASTRRTSTSSVDSIVKTRTLAAFMFLVSARALVRRHHRGAVDHPVDRARLEPRRHDPRDRRADDRLHDGRRRAGGDVDRRQADGRSSSCAMTAAVVVLILGLPHGVSAGDALHVAGASAGCRRSTSASICTSDYTLWSGLIGGLFLSLSYFGCDQSQVQRYLTAKSVDAEPAVAARERVRQDSAAGADSAHRRADVRVLPVQHDADAVQPGARAHGAREPAGRRVSGARGASTIASSRRARSAAHGAGRGAERSVVARVCDRARGVPSAQSRRRGRPRRSAVDARARRHRRHDLHGRELRVSDVHPHVHADRPRRADDRGHPRRRRCRRARAS